MALYEKLEALTPLRLSGFSRGDLVSRIVTDVDEIQNLPLRVIIPIASSLLASTFSIALTAWLLPQAGFALGLILVTSSTLVPWLTTRNLITLESHVAHQRGQLSEHIIEHFAGMTDIVMLGATDTSLKQISEANNSLMATERANALRMGSANALLALLQGAALLSTTFVATHAVLAGLLSPVTMVVVSLLPLAAFESVIGLPAAVTSFARVRGSATRLVEILETPCVTDAGSQVPTSSEIAISKISLHWPDSQSDVITDFDLTVPVKNRVGIIGPSGSGKSTVVSMLIKFLRPSQGTYLLGNLDTSEISGITVRDYVVATGHDAHLFATSIRENLSLASPKQTSDEELWAAIRAVDLENWVETLPQKLDTIIGENGSSISGGQRQRLLLARMFIRNPEVWVLDEPTEHLDTKLAHFVMDSIVAKSADSSLIVVSHRPADLDGSDTIINLGQ